jgi:RNA polymerase-binding transcription factor DksA
VITAALAVATATRQAEFRSRLAAARARVAGTLETADQARQELEEIEAAAARLEAGRYGVCEACRQPIPLARLRAMPATRRCATCQSHQEAGR